MTRCYEFYCLYERRPEKCDLSRRGEYYVKSYLAFLRGKGVNFDGSPTDKALFWRLFDVYGSEYAVTQVQDLALSKPLPEGQFNIIYADPPWRYEHTHSDRGDPTKYYPVMTVEDICNLKIPLAQDAILFLWATNPKLEEAFQVLNAWGFNYRTNLVWVKDKFGLGYFFRGQHELLLVARKGDMPVPAEADRASSVLTAPRRSHSQKPEEVYEIIEKMYPNPPFRRLELFARNQRDGWTAWGDQLA